MSKLPKETLANLCLKAGAHIIPIHHESPIHHDSLNVLETVCSLKELLLLLLRP